MATLSFARCECGIRLRIAQQCDDQHQVYTCRCKRKIALTGTVLRLDISTQERPFNSHDWIQALPSSIGFT